MNTEERIRGWISTACLVVLVLFAASGLEKLSDIRDQSISTARAVRCDDVEQLMNRGARSPICNLRPGGTAEGPMIDR